MYSNFCLLLWHSFTLKIKFDMTFFSIKCLEKNQAMYLQDTKYFYLFLSCVQFISNKYIFYVLLRLLLINFIKDITIYNHIKYRYAQIKLIS